MISFSLPLWRYTAGKGSWYFVTLPITDTDYIKWVPDKTTVGFGSIRVEVIIGKSNWQTTLFPTKEGKYILPIKAEIRKKEHIFEGKMVQGEIRLI